MPIRSCVTISLVPEASGGPFVFWDDLPAACATASALGFDAVEVFPSGPDAEAFDALPDLLARHGLALAAVGTGAGWVKHRLHLTLPDGPARARARDFIKAIIDRAGPLGAPAIIGSMQGRSGGDGLDHPTAVGHLADALEDLGEHAKQYGVPLLYEPLNRYETNLANTVEKGVEILKKLSTQNVKILADLFHMNIEEANVAEALRMGVEHVGHVHFVDSNRRAAGFGHLDYPPIVAAIRALPGQPFVSAEALPLPSPEEAARQTIAAFRTHFGNPD